MKSALFFNLSKEDLTNLIRQSGSLRHALSQLGYPCHGSTFYRFKEALADKGVELSLLGLDAPKRKHARKRTAAKDVLTVDSGFAGQFARRVIIREELVPRVCAICNGGETWNGLPLVLRMDHVNGIRNDHRLDNLRFVCPNCDSQLPTFTGRNVKHVKSAKHFCSCGVRKWPSSICCPACARVKAKKIKWPDTATLRSDAAAFGYCAVARKLGVTDNAVRKHILKN